MRRRQARKRAAIAATSSVLVLGALVAVVVTSPGWPVVQQTFFDLAYGREVLPKVFDGLLLNIRLTILILPILPILLRI